MKPFHDVPLLRHRCSANVTAKYRMCLETFYHNVFVGALEHCIHKISMSRVTLKRSAPAGPQAVPASSTTKKQKLQTGKGAVRGVVEKVRLDDLQWKAVTLPDQMEDYEGFFGLEEIDGVEVVKDAASGTVSYNVAADARNTQKERAPAGEDLDRHGEEEVDAGEWAGFEDNESRQHDTAENNSTAGIVKAERADTTKRKSISKSTSKTSTTTHTASTFSLLPEDSGEGDTDVAAWQPLRLSRPALSALSVLHFARPTTIQSSAIPHILSGEDLIGKAPTGSGKTLAFGIPLLEHWLANHKTTSYTKPMALIVLPTRELAMQIEQHLGALCKAAQMDEEEHGLSIVTLTGGLSIQKQRRLLERADVVVATPGRLWEVMSEAQGLLLSLRQIRFLVVDEADRLLSQGHFKELEDVVTTLDRKKTDGDADDQEEEELSPRQTLVFSATLSRDLQQKLTKHKRLSNMSPDKGSMDYLLAKLNFRSDTPKFVDANPTSQMATKLREGLVECPGPEKDLHLYTLLLYHPSQHVLVFVNSISAVRRLVPFLQNLNIPALALHSQMPQKARIRSIERFSAEAGGSSAAANTTGAVLVATDVAARGLDIPAVRLVVHYHLPRTADTYVHRSGRTARAHSSGNSILLCAAEEIAGVRRLIGQLHNGYSSGGADGAKNGKRRGRSGPMQSLDLDRRVVARLKPRAALAKMLADAVGAKEKKSSEDAWMREAAEELGVEYDSQDLESGGPGAGKMRGRGKRRKEKEREARGMTKVELREARAELRALLAQRVNVGVSERYLTMGGLDIDALLSEREKGEFLGRVPGLDFAPLA